MWVYAVTTSGCGGRCSRRWPTATRAPRCELAGIYHPMFRAQARWLDVDEFPGRMYGGPQVRRLSWRRCNRQAGARAGNAARGARAARRRQAMSRWAAGAEVYADRGKTAIVLAGLPEEGWADVELLPLVEGTDAAPALAELARRYALGAVAIDPKSNAATLVEPARAAGLVVACPDAAGVALAHGTFADLITAGRLRHHNQDLLTAAVRGAEARRLAGAEAIQRYGTAADPAPAVAAELAVWALLHAAPQPFFAAWR
jgi:hypothetical protein